MAVALTIDDRRIEPQPGQSLFDAAESAAIRVPTSCRKNGKCGECLMEILEGADLLSAPLPPEQHLRGDFRLSCCARIEADAGVVRCRTLRREGLSILTDGASSGCDVPLEPAVRVEDAVALGLALDVGTTTVVGKLIDLKTGEPCGAMAFENPQRFAGSDVMSRIAYDGTVGGHQLQRVLVGYLQHAIDELPCDRRDIREVIIAGNATMRDLFFGLDVQPIGQRPYQSITEQQVREGTRADTSLAMSAHKLGLEVHPDALVHGLPIVSGHVGADTAACMLTVGSFEQTEPIALIDIGTNTEVVVGHRGRILAASCPAGPAFEGGLLSCGMPAYEGAIERVRIDDAGQCHWRTIGNQPPAGICGSGLIDLLSELRRTGRLNELGRFETGEAFDVAPERDIRLTAADVSQFAQAKGANAAGLNIVLKQFGIEAKGLQRIIIAGGFGRHLDVAAAQRIGLIPSIPAQRVVKVGNAAMDGAVMALRSLSLRRRLQATIRRVEHVELETDPEFFDAFVEGCQYKPFGLECAAK